MTWRPYSSGMGFVVLCGPAKNPPDLVAGPCETAEDADDWLTARVVQLDRYSGPMPLTAPQTVECSGAWRHVTNVLHCRRCHGSAGKRAPLAWGMITCVVEYVIVPAKIDAFERFGRRWMELVDSHRGKHHGYFLPAEGRPRGPAIRPWRCSASPVSLPMSNTVPCSASTRTSSKRTASGMTVAACSVTNGPSCGRCCPGKQPA